VITGKVLGGAVQRNKIKRRTTDAIWQSFAAIQNPIHGVFRMRADALNGDFEELKAAIAEALVRASK
jgi:ribonuclease P protein component